MRPAVPRRPPGGSVGAVLWLIVLILVGLAADALLIEPYHLQVTHSEIQGTVAAPLKIALLSDLHTRGVGRRERRILAALDREKPDVIVITGDSLAGLGGTYEEVAQVYRRLHAPLGVWFVHGNWENDQPIHPLRRERAFYEEAGVRLLVNAGAELRPGVWVLGVDDPFTGPARLDVAMAGVPHDAYKILLFHSPAYFDRISGQVDLALAGHTHGGQVHIPFVKPFWLPRGSGHYLAGWYEENGSRMYVSRGLGMSMLPVRFLCRPEVAIITVVPQKPAQQSASATTN